MADIKAVDLKTDAMTTPLGLDDQRPSFSWKLKSSGPGTLQASYRIGVYSDSVEDKLVWDSGVIQSGRSTGILYGGKPLKPATRYFWMVSGTDISGNRFQSRLSWFETGLMGTGKDVWDGAEWIGSYKLTANADAVTSYRFQTDFFLESGSKAGIILAARNKDNFILFEIDLDNRLLTLKEFCDNAWDGSMAEGNIPTETTIGRPGGYPISTDAIPAGKEQQLHRLVIEVRDRELSVFINNCPIIWKRKDTMPKAGIFTPRRSALMNVGFRQLNSRAAYRHVIISDINTRSILQRDDFSTETGVLSGLGKVKNGSLFVVNRFELVSPVPAVNLKRSFLIAKKVANARLYAAARGFYEAYLNGSRTDDGFYHPGFTDYRLRIAYQTFDVTALLKQGINTLTVMVAKGYFSGFCGYCGPCIYGTQNSFIGKLVITYSDGTKQIVVTDENWLFTDKGPVTDADYLDGETYDARLENALFEPEEALADPGSALSARNDTPAVPDGPAARESIMPAGKDHKNSIWRRCGVHPWPERPSPTNGTFDKEIPFLLSSQCGPYARAERILDPISIHETQPGHFVYDFGQNMVGTVRLRVRGKQGQSLKLRYGEMCYPNGEIYIKNLRSAANTDTYTLKGSHVGETFIPSFTAHGFRYVEITGNGELLENNDCILSLEGVVITNAPDVTGHFECSDPLVNQLQSNIQWGERCNFLLVPTDCPQRNERFGWTGDAQVFASTAASIWTLKLL
ncbi:MAG: family 78 glycoside hydrolase catalytic domain [Parasporobacterium sp.]|nr:family 78 glycoside hydrolase catalytic domain [Parasporobacterium sp.]